MRTALLILVFTSVLYAQNEASLTFSEVMFYTTSSENSEFVEIYNTSSTATIDLSTIEIHYDGSNKPFTEYNGGGYLLGPGKYAVIFENDLDLATGVYAGKIDGNALILMRTSTSWGMVNTTDKVMQILDATDQVIDTYTYSASNTQNYSDEKRSMTKDNTSGNWANSVNEYGTPGGPNSVPLLQNDLCIQSLSFNPNPVFDGDDLEITLTLSNNGSLNAAAFTVNIFEDINQNRIADAGELLKTENITNLAAAAVSSVSVTKNSVGESTIFFIGEIVFGADQNTDNNTKTESISVFPPQRNYKDIVINEIMYDPESSQPEWVELYNTSGDDINLKDWSISDASSSVTISNTNLIISSGSYLVLIDDGDPNTNYTITSSTLVMSLPSLNNSGDEIVLKDFADKSIDSVDYKTAWGDADEVSLERIVPIGNSNDASNWGLSLAGNGATPGLINTLSPKQFDVEIASISTAPQYIIDGTDATISVTTKNNGLQSTDAVNVTIYNDVNKNDVGDAGEEIFNQNYTSIASGDSVSSVVVINALAIGEYQVIANAVLAGDEYAGNNSKIKTFQVIPTPSAINDIVINEFMYDPNSGEPEWIEIYNRTNAAINLKNWTISDASSSVLISDVDYNLGANEFLVLSDDPSVSTLFTIPSDVIIVALPALNNSGDDIVLRDSLNRVIDSLTYGSDWGDDGISAERKRVDISTTLISNWSPSIDADGGTPGKENSIETKQFDLTFSTFNISPEIIYTPDAPRIYAVVKNIGYDVVGNFDVVLYQDNNKNGIAEAGEEIISKTYNSLNVDDSLIISHNLGNFNSGEYNFIAVINYVNDERLINNTKSKNITVLFAACSYNDIVINEIMYKPNRGNPEWIELYNRSSKDIDLRRFSFGSTDPSSIITNSQFILPAKGYVIISEESNLGDEYSVGAEVLVTDLFSLNNTDDEIVLYDDNEREIDYLRYTDEMVSDEYGISLERKSVVYSSVFKSNWNPSEASQGATPGYLNSTAPLDFDLKIRDAAITQTNIVAGDELVLEYYVVNEGNKISNDYSITIYNDINFDGLATEDEKIFSNSYTQLYRRTEKKSSFIFTESSAGNFQYIIELETSNDPRLTNNKSIVNFTVLPKPASYGDVIISEFMYAPLSGNPEWIEIFNRTDRDIQVFNWSIGDEKTTVQLPSFIIPAGGFIIISDFVENRYNMLAKSITQSNVIYVDLPSLNNSGDVVRLFDAYNTSIDEVAYSSDWGGESGRSLERYDLDGSSANSDNWMPSRFIGGSAGKKNSVTPEVYDLELTDLNIIQHSLFEKNDIQISTIITNIGVNNADNFIVEISLFNEEDEKEVLEIKELTALTSGDSLEFQFEKYIPIYGNYRIEASILYNPDADTTNNLYKSEFSVLKTPNSYGDVVINEIMYSPISGEAEWVEIYNLTDENIELYNWSVGDKSSIVTISDEIILPANNYFVLAADTTGLSKFGINNYTIVNLPALNNSGDEVKIYNQYSMIIDSLEYEGNWGEDEKSLERRDAMVDANIQSNWRVCNAFLGSTPGSENSVSLKDFDLVFTEIKFIRNDNDFNGQGLIEATIINDGKFRSTVYGVEFFDDKNLNNLPDVGERIYGNNFPQLEPNDTNIIRYNFNQTKTGNFKLLGRINYSNDQRSNNNLISTAYKVEKSLNNFNDLVINEIMYDPLSGNSEWVEIINISNHQINLKNWRLSDLTTNHSLSAKDKWIEPNQYIVLSSSESIFDEFEIDSAFVITMSLPSLNNSGDKLTLSDQVGYTIDEIEYTSHWGGGNGKSLERIDSKVTSQDSTNWQTSFDPNLATPGKANSTPLLLADLELSDITLSAENIKPTDTLSVKCTIKNIGEKSSSIGKIFYTISSANIELRDSLEFTAIAPGDSLVVSKSFNSLPSGESLLEIMIQIESESDFTNNTGTINFFVESTEYVWGDVKINEIMYAPNNDEPEWIELVNTSDKTISLTGWTIHDNSSTIGQVDYLVSVAPYEYIIIADEEEIEKIYNIDSKIIVTSLPSFNNSGDLVKISDGSSVVIDTVAYSSSWGGRDGKSLERIFLNQASSNKDNWSTSLDVNRATPGKTNSVAGGWVDLAITEFKSKNEFTILPAKSEFEIKLENIGITGSGNGRLYIYNDLNKDSLLTENELVDSVSVTSLNAGEEKSLEFQVDILTVGDNRIIAKVVFDDDINTRNDIAETFQKVIKINELRADLVINEVMYSPKSGESEWIELYNNSSKIIDLNGYQIQDSRSRATVISKNIFLKPNEYFVIANDSSIYNEFVVASNSVVSSFPSLNNSGETIVLIDSLDRVIDSLQFTSDWGGASGVSLEKLSPELNPLEISSWGTSNRELRGTPGKVNSITTGWVDLELTDISTNTPYTLYPNKIIGFAEIKNNGISKAENSFLYFYNDANNDSVGDKNELIDSLKINELNGGGLTQVEFEVSNVPIGPLSIVAEVVYKEDSKLENNIICFNHHVMNPVEVKMDIVINEFMNNPIEGNSEWIELFNQSAQKVNLFGYEISDNRSAETVRSDFAIIEPNSFLIIANDSSFMSEFNYHQNVLIMDFPSLNNTGDDIVITNILGKVIDSVQYTSNWIGDKGKSIERKSIRRNSNDPDNWNVSIANTGGTPGTANSYSQREYDLVISNVSYIPSYPEAGDEINFRVTIKNVGKKDISQFAVKILSDNELDNIQVAEIAVNDSISITNKNKITLEEETEFLFVINSSQDQAKYNDSLRIVITPSYLPGSIVISEFMYNPFNGEPEWFEIVNNSPNEIDLAEWSTSDLLTTPTIKTMTYKSTIIKPNEFVVVASDSNVYGIKKESKLLVVKLSSLGNSGDGILVYDKTGRVIDSVKYETDWSELKGQSVERVDLNNDSNDRSNWIQSISVDNATPGYANSIWGIDPIQEQSIVINEIMANPNDDNSEFVEVFNRSEDYIDLGGWTLTDNSGKKVRLSEYSYVLPPNNYFVFLCDSSALYNYNWLNEEDNYQIANTSFALTNSGERLILQDLWGNLIDSVKYNESWNNRNISFTKNKSLERINPHINSNYAANWSTCVDNLGATPGKENSIYTERLSDESKLSVSPNPFSPDADGFEDNTIISYNLTQSIAQVRVRVFDSQGRHVRTIESNRASGSKGEIIFNGFDDNNKPLRIGIYVLFIEALNSSNGVVETMKKAVVVARKI